VFRKNEIEIIVSAFSNIQKLGAGNGAVINAQLQQDSILKVTDSCTFYNCSTQQNSNCAGGAINAYVNGSNSQFIISDQVKFEKCQSYKGGAISVELLNMGSCVVNNVQFKECIVNNDGGGIFAQLRETGGTLTITNHTSFVQCINTVNGGGGILIFSYGSNNKCIISDNVIFEKCEAGMGSAIYLVQEDGASFEVHDVQFIECTSRYYGGTIHYQLWNENDMSSFILDGAQFISCSTKQNGGSLSILVFPGITTISGSTFAGSQSIGIGGAIYAELNLNSALTIDNTQFEQCNSTDSDGGSIFAYINSGSLSIYQVSFVGSSCSQPGSGGAIAIVQQNSNSRISITESSFTNCKTLHGSSRYGWGGAIYIQMGFEASDLSSTNFQLTDLSFKNCKASGAGNNLHILSDDITAVGNQIIAGSLLTVKDSNDPPNIISDLYINEWYCFDYMGINKSKANSGNAPFTYHEPLFVSPSLTPKFNDPYVVDAEYGKDEPICGNSRLKCQTIMYILNIDKTQVNEYPSNPATINIELQTNTQLENGIMINSNTPIGNNFKIQSSEYTSEGTDYIKRQIQTSSFSNSLFTISGTNHLELLGLHFDNLNPSATATTPFILISQTNDNKNPEVIIKDCIFEQINPELNSLNHTLVKVSGGHFIVENTIIQNYEFINAQRVIELIGSGQYQVDVINSEFKNISQVGTSGDNGGATIFGSQDQGRNLFVRECIFTDITSNGNGGAICISGEAGTTEISGSTFIRCKGRSGGAIYASKGYFALVIIDNQCYFKDCESNSQNEEDSGGAIFIAIQMYFGEIYIRNSQFDGCKGNNNRGGAIQIILSELHTVVIEEVQFLNCQGSKGGAIDLQIGFSRMSIIKSKFNSCSSTSGPGGAIHSILNNVISTLIENVQFELCNSANFDGGSIFASITGFSLTINQVTFIGSSCTQPGSGGAIAIVQQTYSRISITESSFTNCQTLAGSSGYGWGGAIYIQMGFEASDLSSTNFQLTDLSFQGCSSIGAGNNLHIRLPNTYNSGIAIATNSLLTVKDLSNPPKLIPDLYTNVKYSKDYMGIDESKVNDGNAPYSDHQALFLAGQLGFITKEYYIRSSFSLDENDCSQLNPCKTINHILSKSLPIGFVKGLSIVVINLLSEISDQTNMIISSETELNNIITIQSDRFVSRGTDYTKQSILTSFFDTTLFTISNTGRLKLLGLHFDNLNPSSTNPLISISQSYDSENLQVIIKDCIFEQINPELNSLHHSIIVTQDGTLLIENTLIQNYEFENGQSFIELNSSGFYQIDIVNSEFNNIHQVTNNQQGGAAISGSQTFENILRIRDQCKFTDITSTGQGGAIYCTGRQLVIEINKVSFIKCKGLSGGAIFASSQDRLSLTIENQSEFKQCETFNNNEELGGGAIYLMQEWGHHDYLFIISNSIFEECKGNNNRGGALQITLIETQSVIDGVQFINCQGSRGGSIYGIITSADALIENTQFESSNSNSDGGSIFAQINSGTLSINQVTFVGSSCVQPGSGGAIAIVQQTYSRISITESSFTNCQTLAGSSGYGWGGAIYIQMGFEASDLSSTNFQLTDLSFTNCKASGAGNNLHILSNDTTAVGNKIETGFLVTVKVASNLSNIISDLYTNEWYCFDYMGINKSKANSGNAPFTDHEPLFVSPSLTPKFNDPYVVDAEYGKDHPICGNSRLKCQTINYYQYRIIIQHLT
ncbi:MAG: hypothetical protein EZS28_022627, partial [Streblomastix strix]